MAAAATTISRRPLHLDSEKSQQGGLPWRGNGTNKVMNTMREVDPSESPPPPPPPARIPRTLLIGDSATNNFNAKNAIRHSDQEEQDDKTEHTVKSVSDLVHKFETKIRNASSSTKKKCHDIPKSSTDVTAKAARSQTPTKTFHDYKGSSDETSDVSDDDENCDDDDITALSVSEKAKFFEHLSTRNSSPVPADHYSSNVKLAGAPQFQTKFIHAALRSQLLRSSSTGTLGKIPPLQQHILSLQVLNKSNNTDPPKPKLSASQSPKRVTRSAAANLPRDSHYIPQPQQLHRQESTLTHSTVVVDIHSPLKSQLRKYHYERIFKRSKRQMQHLNASVPVDDDISSLTVPSFPEKKDSNRERQRIITNNNVDLERNSSHRMYWALSKEHTDANRAPYAEPCDPYTGSPLEHEKENLQQQRRQNYYELLAYAESLKDMPASRSKRELSSTNFSKNSAHDCQEQEVSQVNIYVAALSPKKHVSTQSTLSPLVETNLDRYKSDTHPENIVEDCLLVAPQLGGGIRETETHKGRKIGAQEAIANHLNKNSLTDKVALHQQGEIIQTLGHDVSHKHIVSAEIPQQQQGAEDEPPSGEKTSSLQQNEKETEEDCEIAPSSEEPKSNHFTPSTYSCNTSYVEPSDTIDTVNSDMRLQCPESPAPSDEAAAHDSNNGDAPSDEKQMPRLSKFIPPQRITNSVSSSLKENIPVPIVAAGRNKRFSGQEELKKSIEKGSSARKRREHKVISKVPLASIANTKRPLRSVPVTPVESSIRSRVQTFNEKRHEIPRQHAGLPPRKPGSSASDDFRAPHACMPNVKSDNSDALLRSTTQSPKLLEKESRETSDEKRISATQDPLQESPISSETNPFSFEDVKADVRTDLLSESTKPSKTKAKKSYASDGERREKRLYTENSNVLQSNLQSVRNVSSEAPSKAISNNYILKPPDETEPVTRNKRVPQSEKKITFDNDDEEICSITMRITRDAKVGPQVGVSISEYGTGSVEVSRLDTPTVQKVANLVLRGNLGKKENDRNCADFDGSTVPGKVFQTEVNNSERGSFSIANQALQQEANPSFHENKNGALAKPADASEYMESTTQRSSYLSGKNSSDIESRPWRKPGQIPGKKTIGGISAVSVCSSPCSDREQLGSSKSVPSSNECRTDMTKTDSFQDCEKHGAFQGSSAKFSFDDGSWTVFSGNEAFTLNTSASGSTLPPPPPKVPHPSQLGAETREARILQGSSPVSKKIGARPVSCSPQPSASSTTISDFTLSHMRQNSQSQKMDQSRSASWSPQTIASIPPPPPSDPHPRRVSETSDVALKARNSLPGVESHILRSCSRSPQPSASSTMSSDFTLRHMRQMSLSPKNSVLRSDLSSPQPSPLRTDTFDPFDLEAQTEKISQSPMNIRQQSVSRSPQHYRLHTDELGFTQHKETRQVSQSPTNSRQRSVSRSSHRKLVNTDDFDPTNFNPPSFSVSSQSSASLRESFEQFARNRDKSASRSPLKFSTRSVSRSPEPSVHHISLDGYRKSSRGVSRSPDSDRSFTTVENARTIPQFRGLGSQSSQASFSSYTNDDSFTLRRMVSRSPQSGSISSSATSDTFTLRNMRSASSSPTPSIPRLDLSREENNEIRKILTEPKSSRRIRQLSMSPEKSIQSSAASSEPSCPSPLRLSPTVVSAFENIDLELGGDVSKGTVRKVTFDNQVKVRAFINDSIMSPPKENKNQSTQAVKKLANITKWTSKMCGCLRPPPKRLE